MYRPIGEFLLRGKESPHKRGDVPGRGAILDYRRTISPQAWGCTDRADILIDECNNLPTSVGMYRISGVGGLSEEKSPHKRGDVPMLQCENLARYTISPQAWGCTDTPALVAWLNHNLPTSVGMYRMPQQICQ